MKRSMYVPQRHFFDFLQVLEACSLVKVRRDFSFNIEKKSVMKISKSLWIIKVQLFWEGHKNVRNRQNH